MFKPVVRKAFTLIELLVVVAIIALLISILLPSLSQAREQGKKAVCLSHMRSIGQATHAYATEDKREQLIPLSFVTIRTVGGDSMDGGLFAHWAQPTSFGGRTSTKDLLGAGGDPKVMRAEKDGGNGYWEAHRRPLNQYVYGGVDQADAKKLEMFHCPSDTGAPQRPSVIPEDGWDMPQQSEQIPLYDLLANSYRINTCGYYQLPSVSEGTFSVGALGHASSAIESPSRVAMYCEPIWYMITLLDTANSPAIAASPIEGWHKKIQSDNAGYCDGSARLTRADQKVQFDPQTLLDMGITLPGNLTQNHVLRRGKTWQTDCYPSPGALILTWDFSGMPHGNGLVGKAYKGWPFNNYTQTDSPDP